MDLTNSIIGIAILVFFLLPVFFIAKAGKNKKNRLLKELESEAKLNDITLTESDYWDESAIGIDSVKGKIIFINERGEDKKFYNLSISDLKSFNTVPSSDSTGKISGNLKKAERLAVVFSFRQKEQPDLVIDFFTPGFGKMSESDIERFIRWSDLIRNLFSPTLNK